MSSNINAKGIHTSSYECLPGRVGRPVVVMRQSISICNSIVCETFPNFELLVEFQACVICCKLVFVLVADSREVRNSIRWRMGEPWERFK